LRGRLVEVP